MPDREKKKEIQKYRKAEIQKFEYLGNEKSFLVKIKNIFHTV